MKRSGDMMRISRLTSTSLLLILFAAISQVYPFHPINYYSQTRIHQQSQACLLQMATDSSSSSTDEDWRDFRARLVATEATVDGTPTTLDDTRMDDVANSYIYEMGDVIEEGSVILSRHEHDFSFGLFQQYFHKSIMLVLEHEDTLLTNGILLNRPTRQVITDNHNHSWNVGYGGPVRGIHDDLLDSSQGEELAFTCLHTLTDPVAKRLSNTIIKDIQWTTLDTAQFLVQNGHAVPTDFRVYCGFASWSPGQLQRELQRNNWYMTSVDSQTILQELLHQKDVHDVFGMSAWCKFASHIGRVDRSNDHDDATASAEGFDDAMLREWVRTHLQSNETIQQIPVAPPTRPAGTILVATTPFLLDHQEFHKAFLLVLEDTLDATIGVLLNLPGPNTTTVEDETVPVRHGGKFGIQGESEKPVTYYHNDESLKDAKVGTPVGQSSHSGIWTCTREVVETAIEMGLASLDDFLVVQGACVLKKKNDSDSLLILSKLNVLPRDKIPQVWDALLMQERVTRDSLNEYMETLNSVWAMADSNGNDVDDSMNRDLNAMAWKSWVSVFLLCDPSLRGT